MWLTDEEKHSIYMLVFHTNIENHIPVPVSPDTVNIKDSST